jgi:hypothetical protein
MTPTTIKRKPIPTIKAMGESYGFGGGEGGRGGGGGGGGGVNTAS